MLKVQKMQRMTNYQLVVNLRYKMLYKRLTISYLMLVIILNLKLAYFLKTERLFNLKNIYKYLIIMIMK